MKKLSFYLGYAATFLIPGALYYRAAGGVLDSYTASVLMGTFAFVIICDQFILASKPALAVKALGAKGLLALHRTAPAALVLIAAAHLTLKLTNGFSLSSLRAILGITAFVILLILAVFSAVIMTDTVLARIGFLAAVKKRFAQRTGMTYKKARAAHGAFVLVAVLILLHALMASTSNFAANPAGAAWLIFWMGLSLSMYAAYRLTGRRGLDRNRPRPAVGV